MRPQAAVAPRLPATAVRPVAARRDAAERPAVRRDAPPVEPAAHPERAAVPAAHRAHLTRRQHTVPPSARVSQQRRRGLRPADPLQFDSQSYHLLHSSSAQALPLRCGSRLLSRHRKRRRSLPLQRQVRAGNRFDDSRRIPRVTSPNNELRTSAAGPDRQPLVIGAGSGVTW